MGLCCQETPKANVKNQVESDTIISDWHILLKGINPSDEGVARPEFPNLFNLKRCRKSSCWEALASEGHFSFHIQKLIFRDCSEIKQFILKQELSELSWARFIKKGHSTDTCILASVAFLKNRNQFIIILLIVVLFILIFIYYLYFCTAQGRVFNATLLFSHNHLVKWDGLRERSWAKIKKMDFPSLTLVYAF